MGQEIHLHVVIQSDDWFVDIILGNDHCSRIAPVSLKFTSIQCCTGPYKRCLKVTEEQYLEKFFMFHPVCKVGKEGLECG